MLMTPTPLQLPMDDSIVVAPVPVTTNAHGIDPQDGQSEISLDLARHWGILSGDGDPLQYAPCQYRGVVRCADTRMALAKGTLVLNTTLMRRTFALHASCCEIFGTRRGYEHVEGLEMSKSTQKGWRPPKLTCQVLAAPQQRIACVSNAVQRDALLQDRALWLETRKQHTVQDLVAESFGLNAQHAAPIPEHLSVVGGEDIALKAAGADAQEMPVELLQESFVEDSPHVL